MDRARPSSQSTCPVCCTRRRILRVLRRANQLRTSSESSRPFSQHFSDRAAQRLVPKPLRRVYRRHAGVVVPDARPVLVNVAVALLARHQRLIVHPVSILAGLRLFHRGRGGLSAELSAGATGVVYDLASRSVGAQVGGVVFAVAVGILKPASGFAQKQVSSHCARSLLGSFGKRSQTSPIRSRSASSWPGLESSGQLSRSSAHSSPSPSSRVVAGVSDAVLIRCLPDRR